MKSKKPFIRHFVVFFEPSLSTFDLRFLKLALHPKSVDIGERLKSIILSTEVRLQVHFIHCTALRHQHFIERVTFRTRPRRSLPLLVHVVVLLHFFFVVRFLIQPKFMSIRLRFRTTAFHYDSLGSSLGSIEHLCHFSGCDTHS